MSGNKYWESWKVATPDTTGSQRWNTWRGATNGGNHYYQFTIPKFSYSPVAWLGSSYVFLELSLSVGQNFIILPPRGSTAGSHFCLAVRYGTSPSITRFKIFKDIGEQLSYPLYNGEVLPSEVVFEVWSSSFWSDVSLTDLMTYLTSVIVPRDSCCNTPNIDLTLTSNGVLFTPDSGGFFPLPLVPSQPYVAP